MAEALDLEIVALQLGIPLLLRLAVEHVKRHSRPDLAQGIDKFFRLSDGRVDPELLLRIRERRVVGHHVGHLGEVAQSELQSVNSLTLPE